MSASNGIFVTLGDYIEQCDERNSEGKYTLDDVRGISTEKKFIPTKANMDGVSLTSYKVVNGFDFAYVADTSRRGDKIALALNTTEKSVLISSIYTTFRCKDNNELLPEYLYLILSRSEFDRYSRFNSWGSARETFDWDELCRIQIPKPDITIQRELVATYNGLKALAEQNEALIEPLSKACEAFIVDCKSKYPEVELGEYIEEYFEQNVKGLLGLKDVRGVSIQKEFINTKANMDNVPLDKYKIVANDMFAFNVNTARMGDKFAIALCKNANYLVSSIYGVFFSKDTSVLLPEYLFIQLKRSEFDRYVRFNSWGSARETFTMAEMSDVKLPLPPLDVQQSIVALFNCLEEAKKIASEAREKLKSLCPALVQRAANS